MSELDDTALLRLAARASGAGRLENPDGTAKVRNPFCGDRLTVDVKLEDGRISAVGYEIRACLVCQASTSIVAEQAVGQSVTEVADVAQGVDNFLKNGAQPPENYDVFAPMQQHKNRHVCVMMPFQGIAEAVQSDKD